MKKINLVKSLTNLVNNRKGLLILCLSLATFGVNEAWGTNGYWAKARTTISSSSPTGSGKIYEGLVQYKDGGEKQTTSDGYAAGANSKSGTSITFTFTAATPNDGYSFKGWATSDGSTTVESGSNTTGWTYGVTTASNKGEGKANKKTFYAVFSPIYYAIAYTYAYQGNGQTWVTINGTAFSGGFSKADDSSSKETTGGSANTYTIEAYAQPKEGYVFKGWYKNADCSGEPISMGDANKWNKYTESITQALKNPGTEVKLYAKFEEGKSYTYYATAYAEARTESGEKKNGVGLIYISCKGNKPTTDSQYTASDGQDHGDNNPVTTEDPSINVTADYYAKALAGYSFEGWYKEAALTNFVGKGTSQTEGWHYQEVFAATSTDENNPTKLYRYAKFVPVKVNAAEAQTINFTAQTETKSATLTFPVENASSNGDFNAPTVGDGWSVSSWNYANNQVTVVVSFSATENTTTKGDHSATVTLTAKSGNSASGQVTAHVEMTPAYTNNIASSYLVEASAIDLNTLWTSSSNGAKHYEITSFTPIGTNNEGATEPAINGTTLSLGQAGTVNLKLTQDAGTSSIAGSATYSLTINKRDNAISSSFAGSMFMDAKQNGTISSNNSVTPITAAQTSGSTIAVMNDEQTQVTSNHNLGTAIWTLSQPENYKYKAANATLTVNVVKQAEATDCYVLNDESEYTNETKVTSTSGVYGNPLAINGPADKLTFDIKYEGSIFPALKLFVEYSIDGGNSYNNVYPDAIEERPSNYMSFGPYTLDSRTTHIRFFSAVGTTNSVKYKNVRVTRKTYLNADNVDVTETSSHNPIHPGETGVGTLTINHSLANGEDLKVKWDNSKFTIGGKTAADGINLGDKGCSTGVTELAIEYVSQEAGEDNATVVIYNNVYRATATITGTTNKQQQTITWKENIDILTAGTDVEDPASSTVGNVTYTTSDEKVISVEGNIIHALKAGTATITAISAGNTYYADAQAEKEITVTDDKVQYIVWNQSFMNLKIGDGNKTLEASAQSDVEGCTTNGARQITYTSNNESVVKIVNNNQLQIMGIGTTTITATQAGGEDADGHTYIAASVQKKVVVRDPNAECVNYIYIQEGEWRKDLGWNSVNHQTPTYEIDFHGQEPGYYNVDYKGESHDFAIPYYNGQVYIDQYVNGDWEIVQNLGKPAEDQNLNTGNVNLNRAATKMRFRVDGYTGYYTFKDCTVTLARYLEATNTLNKFEAKVGAQHKQTLSIKYSNIEGPLTIKLTSGKSFAINMESIDGDCGSKGTENIEITYFPSAANEEETDVLTITDGKNSTLVINLTGSASKTERHIVWEQEPSLVYTVETITFNAEAKTNLNEVAGEVYYTLAQNSTAVGNIDGNTLSFTKYGNATVVVNTIFDNKYTDAVAVSKTWNVSLTPTEIVTAPEIDGDIVYGAQLSDLALKAGVGAAQNTVNQQAVEGTFAITSGDLSSAGEHTITVTFTPTNTDMFATCTKEIPVSVLKANPSATAHAGEIIYGATVESSELTNTGETQGTWTWTDARKNDVLNAGTHNDLQVHFVPENKNYNEADATVSLTVNKAAATLNWTSAPTEADVNDKVVTYIATSNHAESEITYSITGGADYATIDANTGVLTITKAGTITVQALQAASTNYKEATLTQTTTLTGVKENEFTGNGDWNNPENWTNGVPTDEGGHPNVVISGDMTISDAVSVGNLTIENNGQVTITGTGSLSITGSSETIEQYGNLIVSNGGNVSISIDGGVTVGSFIIESSIGTTGTSISGQVTNGDKVIYTNGAYIDINMDPKGTMDDTQWYGFTVPFPVDVESGVYRKEGDTYRKCTYGVDYMINEYDANQRYTTGKGWKYIKTGLLQPGHFYYFTVNGSYNTYRFKAAENTLTPNNSMSIAINGDGPNANWNAVGNSTLTYVNVTGNGLPQYVQTYINGQSTYQVVNTSNAQFVVGCPFFIQASQSTTMVLQQANQTIDIHYAPREETTQPMCVRIAAEGQRFSDQMYLTASEEALDEYELGLDLAKAGVGTKSAQLWVNAYGQQLCVNNATLINNQAYYNLSVYTPQAGNYELSLPYVPTNGTLYLLQDGYPIWNLNESPYTLECAKGTTNEYGLLFVVQEPQAPTGSQTISGNQSAQKILKDQQIYIQKNGTIFTISGQKVK